MLQAAIELEYKSLGQLFYEKFPVGDCKTGEERLALSAESNIVQRHQGTIAEYYDKHGSLKGLNIPKLCPRTMDRLENLINIYSVELSDFNRN